MGARTRAIGAVVVPGLVLGLGAFVLWLGDGRSQGSEREALADARVEAAPAALAPVALPASETPLAEREALGTEDAAGSVAAPAPAGAELFGRVTLPGALRARMGDVRVFWTYERGVQRSGSLATLPPVSPQPDGTFRLRNLPLEAPLVLWAIAPFAPDWGRALAPFVAGEQRELDVALEWWVTVAGRVVGEQGQPLEAVRITATRRERADPAERGGSRATMEAQSPSDGSFQFALSPALWELSFSAAVLGGSEVLVDARQGDVTGLTYELESVACLRIVLRWPDGTLARQREVSLDSGSQVQRARDGSTLHCGLSHGEHEFFFSEVRGGTRWVATARVRIPETTSLELVLRPPRAFRIAGTVRDPDGRVVPGATVEARQGELELATDVRVSSVQLQQSVPAGDGTFAFDDLEEGRWTLVVVADGWWSPPRTVLVDGATPPQEFVLARSTLVEGRVLDHAGRPVVGARLRVLEPRLVTRAEGGACDESGHFVLQLPLGEPGRLSLLASAPGHTNSLPVELALAPGERVEGVVLNLRPACSLLVRVLDVSGQAVEGARLSLVGRAARFTTDAAGEGELTTLPEGTFQLRVEADGFLRLEQPVVLTLGAPQHLELTLTRMGAPR